MDDKKTNLALSADVTTSQELLNLIHQVGDEICVLKTHIDIVEDFTPELTRELIALAQHYQFVIFEDRKFADIGNTVMLQYAKGIYKISSWANIINAHSLPGPGVIDGLLAAVKDDVDKKDHHGLLLIAEMSSKEHLLDKNYREQTLALAKKYPQFVIGFITQQAPSLEPHWLNFTPGVQITSASSATERLGQQYISPQQAILENGADIIIVGRGIISHPSPKSQAKLYRAAGWQSYLQRLNSSL